MSQSSVNPMNQRIIYPTPEGGVAVLIPSPFSGLTIEEIAAKDVPAGVPFKIVEAEDIPADRSFRGAWEHSAAGISVSVPKAKEIHKNRWREARGPLLAKLDTEFMRAVEADDAAAKASIAAKKQALRDVTKATLPNDLNGIKATWPEVLNG